MKRLLLPVAIILLAIPVITTAQKVNSCGYIIPPKSVLKTNFQSVYEARDLVNKMLDTIKWKENFRLREQNGMNNAYATMIQNQRWIVYDNHFLENIDSYASTKWASISIMAHEMGHHYYNHVMSGQGSTLPSEIQADAFSGYLLNRLGATLDQSIAAMSKISPDKASSTHPGKADRLTAITKGWNTGLAEKNGTVNNTGGNNGGTTTPPVQVPNVNDGSWIGLGIQSNRTETVYLSDDGKKFQAAELKAGETFVFKFEIFNYGWLKLPYYNGSRTFKLIHGKDYMILQNRKTKNWTVVEVPE